MMLPEDLTKRFTEDLIRYEEDKKMPHIMSAERIGMEKGMLTEAREMVLEALPWMQDSARTLQKMFIKKYRP
ncbi:MAG: hypothetical protein R6U68_03295 [Desulfobacteraceae bacterium]